MTWLSRLLLLATGGALGTISRYLLSGLAHRWLGVRFAWGTLAVNLLGCLLLGIGWGWMDEKGIGNPAVRLFLFIGFCGAFTTFSTYMLESMVFLREGQWVTAVVNMAGSTIAGLVLVAVGIGLGRL